MVRAERSWVQMARLKLNFGTAQSLTRQHARNLHRLMIHQCAPCLGCISHNCIQMRTDDMVLACSGVFHQMH